MRLKDILSTVPPKQFCQIFTKEIEAEYSIKKVQITMGDEWDHYILRINKEYQGINIELESAFRQSQGKFDEYYLRGVKISAEIKNQYEFHLGLWRKDFFDKLFGFYKPQTGYKEFDSIIGFKTNREKDLSSFLRNSEIRNSIMNDKRSTFNIRFEKDIMKVKLNMSQHFNDIETIKELYYKYTKYLDELIKVEIIKTTTCNK